MPVDDLIPRRIRMLRFLFTFLLAILLTACGGGGSGESGENNSSKANALTVYSYTPSSTINSCSNGGVTIHFGFDQNENGILDNDEIDAERDSIVCYGADGVNGTDGTDGSDGLNSLIKLTTEPSGTNCSNGGVQVNSGLDTNSNNVLDGSEVNNSEYICNPADGVDGTDGIDGTDGSNGSDGVDGTDGQDGTNSLLVLSSEPEGENCPNGGVKVTSGLDTNSNDNLDSDEILNTQYVCNGEDLRDTLTVLIISSDEPPGSNCPAGGEKFSSGIDDNDDGILQINEIDAISYSCTVLSEYETLTDIEAASTSQCLHGGTVTYVGLDSNGNGTLDSEERQSQSVSCAANGHPSITISNSSYLANTNVNFSKSFPLSDPDSDPLSISDVIKPAWLSLTVIGNNLIASGTPSDSDIGQFSVSFLVTDTDLSVVGSFLLDTQAAPDNLGTFPFSDLDLGEAGFSKIVDFEFADAAAFDRTVTFTVEASSTATENLDFSINYASQTVPAGETKTFFELEIINDTAYENIETIMINATVDSEKVDQVTFSLNDNNGYEVLGSLSEPMNPKELVIVNEKVEISTSNYQYYIYDLNLEAITSSCYSFPEGCSQFPFTMNGHSYLNNYYAYDDTSNQVKKYTPESANYQAISNLPIECGNAMNTSFQVDTLYVLGCQSEYEESTGTLYTYNLNTDSWNLVTSTGPNFTYGYASGNYKYLWENIIKLGNKLYLYRGNNPHLLSYDLISGIVTDEILNNGLGIFSENNSEKLAASTRAEKGKFIVPLFISPAPTTKIIEFDPVTKEEVVHEFNIGQNAGNGVIFHNGKWFYFGGSNNLGTSDRVVSFILGDN